MSSITIPPISCNQQFVFGKCGAVILNDPNKIFEVEGGCLLSAYFKEIIPVVLRDLEEACQGIGMYNFPMTFYKLLYFKENEKYYTSHCVFMATTVDGTRYILDPVLTNNKGGCLHTLTGYQQTLKPYIAISVPDSGKLYHLYRKDGTILFSHGKIYMNIFKADNLEKASSGHPYHMNFNLTKPKAPPICKLQWKAATCEMK